MEPAILVKNLSYSYGHLEAVKSISFQLDRGEILGLLGPNGAGKSTTIKMLTGQLTPDSGSISILGREMSLDDPDLQALMGVCFEEKNLYMNMSGRENLDFFARLFGLRGFTADDLLHKESESEISICDFEVDEETNTVKACPAGHKPLKSEYDSKKKREP